MKKRHMKDAREGGGRGLFVSGKPIVSVPRVLGSGSVHVPCVEFYPWLNTTLGVFYLQLSESGRGEHTFPAKTSTPSKEE